MTDSSHRPRRSCLYMPGSNARALEKAKSLSADVVIFDLEDAVAPEAKAEARNQVVKAVKDGGYGPREIVVRINPLDSEWGEDDLSAVVAAAPDGILLPKVSAAADIAAADRAVPLWAMIETPLAILNIAEIAGAAALDAFVMGTNDLAKDTGAQFSSDRAAFQTALSMTVLAARAHGLSVIDGVFNAIDDEAGLAAECKQGRILGFDGKTLIHPAQLATCNCVFSPSAEEIAEARAVIAAFQKPENVNKGALRVNGAMVERLHLDMARKLLAKSEQVS